MKHNALTRMLCMILALCTVVSMSPMAFATGADETEVPTEPVVETQPVETEPEESEPAQTEPVETEPVESEPVETEPVETEPVETEPVVTEPVETEPVETVPEETVPEETVAEETVPEDADVAAPFGLKGLPEGYVLSDEAMADKAALNEFGVVDAVKAAADGVDYATNEIMVRAESEEEAQLFTEAYNGQLQHFRHGVAVISLTSVSVADAVAVSADMSVALPAAYPNEIIRLDPVEDKENLGDMDVSIASIPERQTWESWVLDTMTNPDPYLLDPTGEEYNYQWHHDVIDTYAAWGVTTGERFVKVAVLDTGVRTTHKELAGRVEAYAVPGSGLGTVDGQGHGTHVAGLIAASMDNGTGGAGVAPGVTIQSFKVLDDNGAGYADDIIEGVYQATDKGAWIINMSLGGYFYNSMYQEAMNYAYNNGVTVIVAMGNDSSNLKCYPAAYKNVIAVGASNQTNNRAYFSNWGSWIDVSAPGYQMWSSYYSGDTAYVGMNGTSQATPVVAGVAALYMSANGHVSPATMEKVLEASCVKGGSNLGKGVVNAANMFSKTKPTVSYGVTDLAGMITYDGKTVPCDTLLELWSQLMDDNGTVIYTTNGKTPSIKNGQIVNGTEYTGPIKLEQFAGKSVTIKAMAINGVGVAGSVKTIKLTVSKSAAVAKVTIEGPTNLVAGKSATYKATVAPEKATQTVTWSIVERSGMTSAKISSSGKLTTSSKQEGYVVIRATSKADTSKYVDFTVTTQKIKPVSSMTMSQKSATLTLGTGYSADTRVSLYISKMTDSSKKVLDPAVVGVKWTSSKTSVATVDQNGNVTAVAAGTATITATAQDGSGKKATCKITVKQRVTGITVSGYPTVAPGSSATYKATIAPTNASSKSVTWSLSGAPAGAKITSKGKVTLPKSASSYIGTSFQVLATAKDGSGVVGYQWVTIQPKCTGLYATYSGQDSLLVKTNSSGYVTSAVLYTFEDDYYSGNDEDIQLGVVGKNVTPNVKWSSSASTVATVDQNGYVVAKKAGTAKITATAQDGSGKKATVTITVRNPVSSMSITTSSLRSYGDDAYIAFGKSATNKVTFADTYGKVSNQAVEWSFACYGVDKYGSAVSDWTSFVKNKGWVKVDSKGKLTVSSKLKSEWESSKNRGYISDLIILVTATSKDNPSVSATQGYYVVKPVTTMFKGYLSGGYIYKDTSTVRIAKNSQYMVYNGYVYDRENVVTICCDSYRPMSGRWQYEMTATSSNPDIVGVEMVVPHGSSNSSSYYSNIFYVYLIGGNKSGTATITVKAGDGSGKTCSFKVKVG